MPDPNDTAYVLGNHAAKIDGLETRMIEVQDTLKGQDKKLDQLLARDNRLKGSLGTIMGVGSIAAFLTTIVVEFFKK